MKINNNLKKLYVDKPDPEGQIILSSDVRKSITLVLNISNKTEKTVQYKIMYKGDCLSGKKSISILPNSIYEYELTYAPSKNYIYIYIYIIT